MGVFGWGLASIGVVFAGYCVVAMRWASENVAIFEVEYDSAV